ncbi:hypothetical protein ACFE04_023082 [Oxalis oulophora]
MAKETTTDKHLGLLKLAQILTLLVVFVAGIIFGLITSSHINLYFRSQSQLFFSNHVDMVASLPSQHITNCTEARARLLALEAERRRQLPFGLIESLIRPPENLSHQLTDDQLFWRASLVPNKPLWPYNRVPKVAFMFLTRGPLPMLPLWERFFEGQDPKLFSIYVHALPGYRLNVSSDSPFYQREIPSQYVEWGTVTLFDAERRLLANALLDFSNERFVLLSESCIPVQNFQTVYRYLTQSTYSFVESYDDPSRYGRGRYSRKMLPDINLYQWRKGSQWFEMHRELAVHVISDTKYYNIFKSYCLPACYPDEHYLPTYIFMSHGSLNANRTVTWVDWSLGGPHPATYGPANITEDFMLAIRNNGTFCSYNEEQVSECYLFARKFPPSALGLLLNLTSTAFRKKKDTDTDDQ